MEYLWYTGAAAVGLALGLHFGRTFAAIHAYWESASVATKSMTALMAMLFGGGGAIGGTAVFSYLVVNGGAPYALGLGVGLTASFFWPCLPSPVTIEKVRQIITLNDALREKLPDTGKRALLIASLFEPPKVLQRASKIDPQQYLSELEQATDMIAEADDDQGHLGPSEEQGNSHES